MFVLSFEWGLRPYKIVAACHVFAFFVCQPIIYNLFISIILKLVTVSFHFYLAFCSPWWSCDDDVFCLSEILGNKITPFSCPISLAFGFMFYSILLILIYTKFQLHLAAVVQVVPASFKSYLSTIRFGVKFYHCDSVLTKLKNCSRKKLSTKNSSTTEPVTNHLNCLANAWLTCPSTLPNSRRTPDCKRSVKSSSRSKELVPAAILSKRQSFSSRFHDASKNHFME